MSCRCRLDRTYRPARRLVSAGNFVDRSVLPRRGQRQSLYCDKEDGQVISGNVSKAPEAVYQPKQ
jgi:hypothetical protein